MEENDSLFFFVVHPLNIDYSSLRSTISPAVNVILSPLCIEPLSEMFVGVLFGIRNVNESDCRYSQRETVYFNKSHSLHIPVDTNEIPLSSGSMEYCSRVELNYTPPLNSNQGYYISTSMSMIDSVLYLFLLIVQ